MEILTKYRINSRKVCGFCYFSAFPRKDGLLPYTQLLAAAASTLATQEARSQPQPYPCHIHSGKSLQTACTYCSGSEQAATFSDVLLLLQHQTGLPELGTHFFSNTWSQAFTHKVRNRRLEDRTKHLQQSVLCSCFPLTFLQYALPHEQPRFKAAQSFRWLPK